MKNQKNKDLVSIIIPYHNNKYFLKNSVKSAINQTYKNIQIIIIFDEGKSKNLNFVKKITKTDKRDREKPKTR